VNDVVLLLACLAVMCGASYVHFHLINKWERRTVRRDIRHLELYANHPANRTNPPREEKP
jgi:hypothetical protein